MQAQPIGGTIATLRKRQAADRYEALLLDNPAMKQSTALRQAVKGTDIAPRTLREFLAKRRP